MARIFGLSHKRIVPIRRESCNAIVATYFIGNQHEHYTPHSNYQIAKIDDKRKVAKLEKLMDIMSFRQGNKFALSVLISTMLAIEKEEVI